MTHDKIKDYDNDVESKHIQCVTIMNGGKYKNFKNDDWEVESVIEFAPDGQKILHYKYKIIDIRSCARQFLRLIGAPMLLISRSNITNIDLDFKYTESDIG